MIEKPLSIISNTVTEAHTRIQQDFKLMNPVVGVNQNMRDIGVPADVMTIDCLKTGKRIILIFHDQQPKAVSYQFSWKAKDPEEQFSCIALESLTVDQLYAWMSDYFSTV
ncbi:MAG: hypothetical protein Q9M28_02050 [Mariprofundaceae bacterium]|nr:hypothetical protein [Mariprofundaceae bacterium]